MWRLTGRVNQQAVFKAFHRNTQNLSTHLLWSSHYSISPVDSADDSVEVSPLHISSNHFLALELPVLLLFQEHELFYHS